MGQRRKLTTIREMQWRTTKVHKFIMLGNRSAVPVIQDYLHIYQDLIYWANFLNAVYFRRGLTCTLGLTADLIDGGQPRAKNTFLKCDLVSLLPYGINCRYL